MQIPDNTLKDLLDKLSKYNKECPMCKEKRWELQKIYQIIVNYGNSLKGIVIVNNICQSCGFSCKYAPEKLLEYRPKEVNYVSYET